MAPGRSPEPTIDTNPSPPAPPPRLTMRAFWRDFGDEAFSLDRGLSWTFARLTRNPGAAIRAYVVDRDPRMTRPLRYFLVGFALLALVFGTTPGIDGIGQLLRVATGDPGGGAAIWAVLQHALWLLLFTVPTSIAAGLRAAFVRHAPSFAEMWVFALYCCGHLLFAWAATLGLAWGFDLDVLPAITMLVLPPAFLIVASLGYFPDPGAGRVLRAALGAALSGGFAIALIAGVLWVAFHVGKAWPGLFAT